MVKSGSADREAERGVVSGFATGCSGNPGILLCLSTLGRTGSDRIRQDRLLLQMLDAAARNTRGSSTPSALFDRLQDAWLGTNATIGVGVAGLSCRDDELPLEGGWSFYAFMAGVRSIVALPTARAADLQQLLAQLAMFRLDARGADAFRDWAWEEDGEAFRIVLGRSFAETLEADDLDPRLRATSMLALRGETMESMSAGVRIGSDLLDQVAARPEFEVDLIDYARGSRNRAHEVDGSSMMELVEAMSDPAGWARAELETSLSLGQVTSLQPPKLGRQLSACLGSTYVGFALSVLRRLREEEPAFCDLVSAEIRVSEVVAALLDTLPSPEILEQISAWFLLDDGLGRQVLGALLHAIPTNEHAATFLRPLLRGDAGSAVLDNALTSDPLEAEVLAWLAERLAPERVAELLERVPSDIAAAILASMTPRTSLENYRSSVERALTTSSKQTRSMLAIHLSSEDDAPDPQTLASVINDTADADWGPRAASLLCARLEQAGLGREALLPLARRRTAAGPLRIAALRALEADNEALGKASAWSPWELLSPVGVRAALRRARLLRRQRKK